MKRDYRLYIKDILDAIQKIEDFVGNISFEEFVEDDKTSSACIRKLEIVGEASKNIPQDLKEKYPHLPWREMAGMRDKIVHFYFGVDYEIVWKVIKERLPEIKTEMSRIIEELG